MKASDYIIQFFSEYGITHIFGYQGGMVTNLVDSISKNPKVEFIQTYHEQTASIAAEGYALESHNFGVAISTSGPGATNMVTGIADAYFDSIPVVYITGQVNAYEYKYDKTVRQMGFQETDIISIVKPICKYATFIDKVENLPYELHKAIYIAKSGRKGPVLLDIPMNVQREEIKLPIKRFIEPIVKEKNSINDKVKLQFSNALEQLAKANRPLILFGGGVRQSSCEKDLKDFLSLTNFPCVCSLMGKGLIDETDANFVGMIGSYGNRAANIILSEADEVLVLGSRLDLRQTGNRKSEVLKNIHFIHIDIDLNEIENCDLPNITHINADIRDFFTFYHKSMYYESIITKERIGWTNLISVVKEKFNQQEDIKSFCDNRLPYEVIQKINSLANTNTVFAVDVGQNQMWAAQTLRLKKDQDFYTSGGLAPMGYDLPIAIGTAFANPNRPILVITGDGGFHMSLQSLLLISQYKLNISVIILNNESLGMITQFQSLYFNSNFAGTKKEGGYSVPDIAKISESVNLHFSSEIKQSIENRTIYNIYIGDSTTVVPKLEYDHSLYDMNPYLSEQDKKELENYMADKSKNGTF